MDMLLHHDTSRRPPQDLSVNLSISNSRQDWTITRHTSNRVVEKLPAELWIDIFLRALPDPTYFAMTELDYFSAMLTDPQLIPVVIASVCRVWREIACDLPSLWATCWLSYKYPELNHIWLNRAKIQPLTLYGRFTIAARRSWEKGDSIMASITFMNSILPYWRQWKRVKLDIVPLPRPPPDSGIIAMTNIPSPFLEVLHLFSGSDHLYAGDWSDRYAPMPAWTPTMLFNTPSLRELKLRNVIHTGIYSCQMPNLVDLEVYHTSTIDGVLLLQRFPQLQRCSIHAAYTGQLDNIPHITHQNLIYFSFCAIMDCGDWEPEICILDFIALPSLSCLHMENVRRSTVIPFLDRPSCHITDIEFTGDFMDSRKIISILEHPCVDLWVGVLTIRDLEVDLRLLRFLRCYSDAPNLIFLEQILFDNCGFDYHDGLLSKCIISRCRSDICDYVDSQGPMERVVQLQKVFISHISDIASHPLDMACLTPFEKPANWVEGCRSGEFKTVIRRDTKSTPEYEAISVKFLLGESGPDMSLDNSL